MLTVSCMSLYSFGTTEEMVGSLEKSVMPWKVVKGWLVSAGSWFGPSPWYCAQALCFST